MRTLSTAAAAGHPFDPSRRLGRRKQCSTAVDAAVRAIGWHRSPVGHSIKAEHLGASLPAFDGLAQSRLPGTLAQSEPLLSVQFKSTRPSGGTTRMSRGARRR
jgi:hypothetical protein